MKLTFKPLSLNEEDVLVDWLISDIWPYHGKPKPEPFEIKKNFKAGYYNGKNSETFWIISGENKFVGLIRLFDLEDITPLFDIRIHSSYRGKGIGKKAVDWLTGYIFKKWPHIRRIEAYTRQDNIAMRRVLSKCGYIKEAHHRKSWPGENGKYFDSTGYGILREDWKENKITLLEWYDEKF